MQFSFVSLYSLRLAAFGLAAFLLSGCDDSAQSSEGAPIAAGEIQASPAESGTDVALVSSVKVRFGSAVHLQGTGDEIQLLLNSVPVEGNVIFSERSQQLTFQPSEALKPNATYRVNVAEAIDADGNTTPAYSWSFNTVDNVGATSQWVIDSCMTSQDIAMLAAINNHRGTGGLCGEQAMVPSAPLAWHCDLAFLAQEHASDLSHMGVLGSVGSNGKGTVERVTDAGVIWRGIAENSLITDSENKVVDQALSSPEQCLNLFDSRLTHIGTAAAPSLDNKNQEVWVQLLIQQ